MLILAGLGNPGPDYASHRHNIGFMAADAIARRHGFPAWSKKFNAETALGSIAGKKVLLVKPRTFMNRSGQAVGEAMRFYKLGPQALTVLYDELDLASGKVRIKTGGGAGGHNGIRSLDEHCGRDFRRVRIGIGHPGDKNRVTGHVLGNFAKVDRQWLDPLLDAIADNAGLLVSGDDAGFMNKIALAVKPHLPGDGNKDAKSPSKTATDGKKPVKDQSHIRQARQTGPAAEPPRSGPMAEMLKRLFGKN